MQESFSRYELESTLLQIAGNYSWTWDLLARKLFNRIPSMNGDAGLHPAERIKLLSEETWASLLTDPDFSDLARRAHSRIPMPVPLTKESTVAYFSPEFGVSEMLPQYSGGLGVLAGDHLKAASDLRMPMLAVGLFYRDGFFVQALEDGEQRERYVTNNPRFLALEATPARVELQLAERCVTARVWKADVGSTQLYLLDTDLEVNDERGRRVSDRLYAGDREHRIRQELLMGVGGIRALRQLGFEPAKFHLNEGHAGFLALELIADEMEKGFSLEEAVWAVRGRVVFTTHTPVPAGIDRFSPELMHKYLGVWAERYGVDMAELLQLGILPGSDDHFNMAAFCVRIAGRSNGVSRLHGEVSRVMFHDVPGGPNITSVTNGVHARTWVHPTLQETFEEAIGPAWHGADAEEWKSVDQISDTNIRSIFQTGRRELIELANRQIGEETGLKPDILTVGFARRFATYKRADLVLADLDRVLEILNNEERPVQFVFAGKAHPADEPGKAVMRRVIAFASDPASRGRFVFIPGYNMAVARTMYAGCDVWLNNPIRPREACGTSGEKAALNGGLNFSILDGWWDECFDGENGWAIPSSASEDPATRDREEAAYLYDILATEIIPLYYGDGSERPSSQWLDKVRHNWRTLGPFVTAARMVAEYGERIYQVAPNA
ncbi:MAG: alpha-glucan family phosphorylase [Acidimicrobiia bacterium]|nr:alpha-glucan family phosphorylase [Acidimicrobiia bacterium]